jgi:enoyl-CoA hydratase/carnithine racemase
MLNEWLLDWRRIQEQESLSMTDRLHVQVDDHVASVRLNRPQKSNAIDMPMFQAFTEIGDKLAEDKSVRAVVLHGAGDHFCAGIDLSVFQGAGIASASKEGGDLLAALSPSAANLFQKAAYAWRELPMPVIAAIKGVAFGGGMQIALGADIRYARPDSKLSVMEIKWGIIPDMAISATAHQVVPVDRLKELAYTARVISGVEGMEYGLVTALKDDPLEAAFELAREIAGRSPDAVRAVKTLFDETWHPDSAGNLRKEAELQKTLMGTPNQMEAVMANMQNRAPEFSDT